MTATIYIGASNQETLRILWTAYQDGLAYCRGLPGLEAYLDADRIVHDAENACEHVLQSVEPLDRAAFLPAYTHAWIAGYLSGHRERNGVMEQIPVLDLTQAITQPPTPSPL